MVQPTRADYYLRSLSRRSMSTTQSSSSWKRVLLVASVSCPKSPLPFQQAGECRDFFQSTTIHSGFISAHVYLSQDTLRDPFEIRVRLPAKSRFWIKPKVYTTKIIPLLTISFSMHSLNSSISLNGTRT